MHNKRDRNTLRVVTDDLPGFSLISSILMFRAPIITIGHPIIMRDIIIDDDALCAIIINVDVMMAQAYWKLFRRT